MKRIVLLALVGTLFCSTAGAGDFSLNLLAAYYPPNLSGYQSSGFAPINYTYIEGQEPPSALRSLGSTWGGAETKAVLSYTHSTPFLVGPGLMANNAVTGKGSLELSPVSINGVGQCSLSPIAFLVFDAGAAIGTGWTAGPFQGLGLNPASNDVSLELTPFGGLVWRVWGAGTFQFDVAALFPGEWNHLVVVATAKVEYKAYTGAASHQAWLYEADGGENFNGTKFYGTYILGYQIPRLVNFVGLMAESEEWIDGVRNYSPMASGGWGSDFRFWLLSALLNFKFSQKDTLILLFQFKMDRDYTDATTRYRSFETRVFEAPYWYFNRIAFSYTHTF
ncbi:MAG TPA: hypothetical protein PLW34_11015 [Termitinemataceae bacterium]|nr:hypothetical protein [Termitinemataceae bacterium]HPQ01378.1 hypothetical protein [Termitinemataceae bacterium]